MMAFDYLTIGASAVVVILAFYFLYHASFNPKAKDGIEYETKQIRVGNATIDARIADTEEKRRLGLMDVPYLPENEGMLFVFDYPGYHSFWMKDVLIPLEILFVDEGYTIVGIQEMQLCKSIGCKTYSPESKIAYAIELNENFSKTHGIKIGERIEVV